MKENHSMSYAELEVFILEYLREHKEERREDFIAKIDKSFDKLRAERFIRPYKPIEVHYDDTAKAEYEASVTKREAAKPVDDAKLDSPTSNLNNYSSV